MKKVGIGFITGRKSFKNVLKTYATGLAQSGLSESDVELYLYIAYDLEYTNTSLRDYKLDPDCKSMFNRVHYIGTRETVDEMRALADQDVLTPREVALLFGDGYGKKRNSILYSALKHDIDYLIFIDDDEYPIIPIKTAGNRVTWYGQDIIKTHLHFMDQADITSGYHCGYISPLLPIRYNAVLRQSDYRQYIEGLSNDILNWDSVNSMRGDGGITFADPGVVESQTMREIAEKNGAKFLSGSNLCLNLQNNGERIPPFYNPPGARGEDTFFSTCLRLFKVGQVPCYTFHDGFQDYTCLLKGVLPDRLQPANTYSKRNITRFLKASVGWARYKPLLTFVTRKHDEYRLTIREARHQLRASIPKICSYFHTLQFERVLEDFNYYCEHVENHFMEFQETKRSWARLLDYVRQCEGEEAIMAEPPGGVLEPGNYPGSICSADSN